jgi:hypothetical protein
MTTFQTPLKTYGAGGDTGNPQTESSGFVPAKKYISLGSTGGNARRAVVTIPPLSTLTSLQAVATSAFAADVSAAIVSWGNSADATRYGSIAVSAVGQLRSVTGVSGCTDFDAGGTIVITVSAVSTTTFTTGGVRAMLQYTTVG